MKFVRRCLAQLLVPLVFQLGGATQAVEVAPDYTGGQYPPDPKIQCTEKEFLRELNVFKDPTLFLSDLGLIYVDPTLGWKQLMRESPLLTQIKGRVQLAMIGDPIEFENFGTIAKLYEAADPRLRLRTSDQPGPRQRSPKIIRIALCGNDAYANTLGFVLEQDFKKAQQYDQRSASLPPSIYPNPIPRLKNDR